MKKYNCIAVFHENREQALFCKRRKEPYQGLYNFPGGKVEDGETGLDAAYRELEEETGISRDDIQLVHLMDLTYYIQDFVLEIYAGQLHAQIRLREEANPLEWLSLDEDFADESRFAGEKNIAHIIDIAKKSPLDEMISAHHIDENVKCIGADGCKGGWITAVLSGGSIQIEKYHSMEEIVKVHPVFDEFLTDMVIGLPGSRVHIRPDAEARKLLKGRASTIFSSPSRQAVYAGSKEKQTVENQKALGMKLSAQTIAIIPKMRELDEFLHSHPQYMNVIKESHPEVCFARLNGAVVMSKKAQYDGMEERVQILRKYLPQVDNGFVTAQAKKWKCNADDIIDVLCLAVTANLCSQGKGEVIPEKPMEDDTGLLMQMAVPVQQRTESPGI